VVSELTVILIEKNSNYLSEMHPDFRQLTTDLYLLVTE
jgi:hypothetical protein